MSRYAPMCCPENIALGFVLATATRSSPSEIVYGETWQATLVDSMGVTHLHNTVHCSACGMLLYGLPHVLLESWDNARQAQQQAVDDAVRKVREAQHALDKAAELGKKT